MSERTFLVVAVSVSVLAAAAIMSRAGPLDPPVGPVTSTYKTLAEVEPRIAVNATNTPGDPTSLYKITQPGSYYLTGNINGVAGKHGVVIGSINVTVDLNGFAMVGTAGSLSAITDGGANRNSTTILRGTVITWGGAGLDLSSSFDCLVTGLIVTHNGGPGIAAGDAAVMRDCLSRDNAGDNIRTGFNANLRHCTAVGSSGGLGISLGPDSVATGCVANFNSVGGFQIQSNSTITHCTAVQNSAFGISAADGCTVAECTARLNAVDGISCGSACVIRGNSCTSNGTVSTTGAGILANADHNRIEANACTNADYGILVVGSGNRVDGNNVNSNTVNLRVNGVNNIVIRTTATGGTPNYSIVPGNSVAPRVSVAGSDGWAGITNADHPWANFGY